ncbi:SulP family inorganic anion transporter [Nocardioides pocheonensis]|uniref:SulP family inorganic anion transporter n=1 Tax=Nocardioides pocheonensis TaxID=661485 RepID=UPI001FE505F5|nr:sulfate permease [Nocardioides pocheonensis]
MARPTWATGYRRSWLRGDVVAGVTVTAYLVPQVMAYADLAGLPAATGLWAAVGALTAYALVGTSSTLSAGPESSTALMTAAALGSVGASAGRAADMAVVLALAVAVLCLLGWFGHLSAIAQMLSRPVLVGYMAGIAGIMVMSQLGKLAGVPTSADTFGGQARQLAAQVGDAELPTLAVGAATLAVMLVGAALRPRAPMALVGMLGATAVVALLHLDRHGVTLVGDVPARLPGVGVPRLSTRELRDLVAPALGIAFVGYTDTILTARSFATRTGDRIDARRELLAVGAANLGSALMHGFPVSSSGSRTAIADAAGARSQLASLVTVVVTLVSVWTLEPLLSAFPATALAAVVVYAAVRLVDVAELRRYASFRRSELTLALATTVAVLAVGVLNGVLVAIGLSVLDLLRRVARPHDAIEGFVPGLAGMHDVDDFPEAVPVPGLVIYRYDSPLFFANAEDFHARALAAAAAEGVRWFVLNTEAIVEVDITAVDALEELRRELESRGIVLALARIKQDLRADLAPSGLLDRIGEEHLFPTLPTAVEAYHAWAAAQPGPA